MRWMTRGALLAAAVTLAAGCGADGDEVEATASEESPVGSEAPATPEVETVTLSGALAVSPAHAISGDGICMATEDFTAFNDDRQQVVIADASGTTVATAEAGPVESISGGCVRWFTAEVPAGGQFYTASVGDWTSPTYAEADLASTNVVITIDG